MRTDSSRIEAYIVIFPQEMLKLQKDANQKSEKSEQDLSSVLTKTNTPHVPQKRRVSMNTVESTGSSPLKKKGPAPKQTKKQAVEIVYESEDADDGGVPYYVEPPQSDTRSNRMSLQPSHWNPTNPFMSQHSIPGSRSSLPPQHPQMSRNPMQGMSPDMSMMPQMKMVPVPSEWGSRSMQPSPIVFPRQQSSRMHNGMVFNNGYMTYQQEDEVVHIPTNWR